MHTYIFHELTRPTKYFPKVDTINFAQFLVCCVQHSPSQAQCSNAPSLVHQHRKAYSVVDGNFPFSHFGTCIADFECNPFKKKLMIPVNYPVKLITKNFRNLRLGCQHRAVPRSVLGNKKTWGKQYALQTPW